LLLPPPGFAADRAIDDSLLQPFFRQSEQNPGKNGIYVLEKGEVSVIRHPSLMVTQQQSQTVPGESRGGR
jgi:hypothetical protein